ncbi:MAG TPA: hypothetical protein PK129_00715, partial [Cellvibrionaceae bacterium]|nr:hypothetical protein [Cellvibrionaceae bacterium]
MTKTLISAAVLLLSVLMPVLGHADRFERDEEGAVENERDFMLASNRDRGLVNLPVQLGPRPFYLVEDMDASPLKRKLQACALNKTHYKPTHFSIGHRGAALQFPEHTQQSYEAA